MQFIWPTNLGLALAVPILLVLYIWAQRRRQKFALRYASLSLVKEAMGKGPGVRRHIPPALFLLAILFMVLGLARPQAVVTIPTNQGTVVLAMDVSGSMLATDVKPNRLEAMKTAAKAFVVKQNENVKIGIVSFAADASIVQTPTTNHELIIAAINRLRPQRATAIGKGILVSLDAIAEDLDEGGLPPSSILTQSGANPGATNKPKRTAPPGGVKSSASIVLLTDGQNNQFPPPLAILDAAIDRGVRIYTIGLGSAQGAVVSLDGRQIRTALDEDTLKEIAKSTDAEYYLATNENDLRKVYENLSTQLVLKTEKTEITFAFTAIAMLLSMVAGALSIAWFNRLP